MKYSIIIIAFIASLFCIGESSAQFQSAALDPDCFFPEVGKPGEIDTINGSRNFNSLGAGLMNIGPKPGESNGRIMCTIDPDIDYSVYFNTGPDFNIHQLDIQAPLVLAPYYRIVRTGHFRSPRYTDILTVNAQLPARIYWQDDQGNYDSSRYTDLRSRVEGNAEADYRNMAPYTAHISSDTVDDLIYNVQSSDSNFTNPTRFFLYFKGGQSLKAQGKVAFEDSSISLDTNKLPYGNFQGDFRGSGRNDLISSDRKGNIFFYRNDPPFSMSKFLYSMRFDTIFSQRHDSTTIVTQARGISMHAISKPKGDSSYDFLQFFITPYGDRNIEEIRIFKGGPDFGSHRLTADSAAFVIHEPYYYDLNFHDMTFGESGAIHDCRDMTGTGNRVLYVGGSLDGGYYGYHYFYVLGSAIDDKIDMFIGPIGNDGICGSQIDTLVADHDALQDVIMGISGYGLIGGNQSVGTVFVVHGSKNIPVRSNNVSSTLATPNSISIFPNPVVDGNCKLDLSLIAPQDLEISLYDLLGRKVYSEFITTPFFRPSEPINTSGLANGTYILEVKGKSVIQRLKLSVME